MFYTLTLNFIKIGMFFFIPLKISVTNHKMVNEIHSESFLQIQRFNAAFTFKTVVQLFYI